MNGPRRPAKQCGCQCSHNMSLPRILNVHLRLLCMPLAFFVHLVIKDSSDSGCSCSITSMQAALKAAQHEPIFSQSVQITSSAASLAPGASMCHASGKEPHHGLLKSWASLTTSGPTQSKLGSRLQPGSHIQLCSCTRCGKLEMCML